MVTSPLNSTVIVDKNITITPPSNYTVVEALTTLPPTFTSPLEGPFTFFFGSVWNPGYQLPQI